MFLNLINTIRYNNETLLPLFLSPLIPLTPISSFLCFLYKFLVCLLVTTKKQKQNLIPHHHIFFTKVNIKYKFFCTLLFSRLRGISKSVHRVLSDYLLDTHSVSSYGNVIVSSTCPLLMDI